MANSRSQAVTLSVRVPPHTRHQLEELAESTNRSLSYLAVEALEQYLAVQAWQIKDIQAAVKEADSPDAKFYDHEEIVKWAKTLHNKKKPSTVSAKKKKVAAK